jgi:hypothetical protein
VAGDEEGSRALSTLLFHLREGGGRIGEREREREREKGGGRGGGGKREGGEEGRGRGEEVEGEGEEEDVTLLIWVRRREGEERKGVEGGKREKLGRGSGDFY